MALLMLLLRLGALLAAAGLSLTSVGASAASGGPWLVVPLLLDFQPVLLPIDTSRRLTEQLEWFCGVHGLETERCATASSSGIAQVVDVGVGCRQPEASAQLPGFLMVRNTITTSRSEQSVAKWRQDETANIARDLCRFAREHGDGEQPEDSECAAALEATLTASFDWLLALELCKEKPPLTDDQGAVKITLAPNEPLGDKCDSNELELPSPEAHRGTEEGVGDKKDAAAIVRLTPIDRAVAKIDANGQDVPGEATKDEPTRGPSNSSLQWSLFNELRFLPLTTSVRRDGGFDPSPWLVPLALLTVSTVAYLSVEIASLCLRKFEQPIQAKEAVRCVGSMESSVTSSDKQSMAKMSAGSLTCGSEIGSGDTSKSEAAIPSESEMRHSEGVGVDAGLDTDTTSREATVGASIQPSSSSLRRARAWSSPCVILAPSSFHGNNQLTPRNASHGALYRALRRDDEDSGSSARRHPSFARAAMAVMMTRPCAVLQSKPQVTAEPSAPANSPTPLLSTFVETDATARRPRQLVAALRLQHIWRSKCGSEYDDSAGNASSSGEASAAMGSITEGDLETPFAQRFSPSCPKY